MNEINNYIEIYDEVMSTIKSYQEKKKDNQNLTISVIQNKDKVFVDIGIIDLEKNCKDIKTKVFDLGFNEYVLPRIVIRYNSLYKQKKENIVKNGENAYYTNTASNGDNLKLVNYSLNEVNYIRCLLD